MEIRWRTKLFILVDDLDEGPEDNRIRLRCSGPSPSRCRSRRWSTKYKRFCQKTLIPISTFRLEGLISQYYFGLATQHCDDQIFNQGDQGRLLRGLITLQNLEGIVKLHDQCFKATWISCLWSNTSYATRLCLQVNTWTYLWFTFASAGLR